MMKFVTCGQMKILEKRADASGLSYYQMMEKDVYKRQIQRHALFLCLFFRFLLSKKRFAVFAAAADKQVH